MKKLIIFLIALSFACPVLAEVIEIDNLPFMQDIQKRHNALWDKIDQVMLGISARKSMLEHKHLNEALDEVTYRKQMADLRDEFEKHKAEWKKEDDAINRDGTRLMRAHGYKNVREKRESDLPSFD